MNSEEIKELRIGNLLYQEVETDGYMDGEFDLVKVEGIYFDQDEQEWLINNEPANIFEGICITRERLLNLGFQKSSIEGDIFVLGELLRVDFSKKYIEIFLSDSQFARWVEWERELKFIHEIQNLYFSLMHKDLEWTEAIGKINL